MKRIGHAAVGVLSMVAVLGFQGLVTPGVSAAGTALARVEAQSDIQLFGAGATFPQPLYEKWVKAYQRAHPSVQIEYNGQGSGAGIKAISDKTVDFAGSDAPLTKTERAAMDASGGASNAAVVFPSVAGGVVPAFNLPEITDLNLSGEVIAKIYMGTITRWNDPAIAELNEDAKLPDLAITPVGRTDGSGTTFVFTNFLIAESKDFAKTIGAGKSVKWLSGTQGGKGNPGVAAVVQQTPGAIGYMEHNYASQNGISYAAVKNKAGSFIKAGPDSISKAAAGSETRMQAPLLVDNIWNGSDAGAYPIASFTYLIVYSDLSNLSSVDEAQGLVDFFAWAIGDEGQGIAKENDYAPLPDGVRARVREQLSKLTYKGQPLKIQTPLATGTEGRTATEVKGQ